jgi:hypothetical protein
LRLRSIIDAALAHPVISGLVLGLLLELVTCLSRFGLGLRMADHKDLVLSLTFGVRIHHGYTGLLLLAAWFPSWLVSGNTPWVAAALVVGLALFTSDLIHHFAVLPVCTGACEFP